MIYFVSRQTTAFTEFKQITVEESLTLIKSWGNLLQYDSETDGLDCHINKLLCIQIGSCKSDEQVVIDATTVDVSIYKDVIEECMLFGQNLKFDLKFLYNYNIKPRNIYDTMTVEQFLHLGYPSGQIDYSLKGIAERRLGIFIDKTVRGQIIWKGITPEVIQYAATDVKYLYDIMKSQLKDLNKIPNARIGAKIECHFVPIVAYMEWCGIKLDENKWKEKMKCDKERYETSLNALNDYCLHHPKLQKYVTKNLQGDLFLGFDSTPYFNIDWQKDEALNVVRDLGFNTSTISKATNKDSESMAEKILSTQKGVDDTFLKLYLDYQGYYKVSSSFGQNHLNTINPKTGRVHTEYRAIGTVTGRMACGSDKNNNDLAKYKGLPINPTNKQKQKGLGCSYPNFQQLPHDEITRACFVSEPGNLFCSCDYSSMEARIGADVYNEPKLLNEFLYGSGDTHAAYAKAVFAKELEGIDTKDVKKLRPDLRNKVKNIEFV